MGLLERSFKTESLLKNRKQSVKLMVFTEWESGNINGSQVRNTWREQAGSTLNTSDQIMANTGGAEGECRLTRTLANCHWDRDWVPWATKAHPVNSLQWHHVFYSHSGKGVEARLVSSHFFFPLPRISWSWRNSSSQRTSTGFVKLGGLWQSLYVTHLERKDWYA